MTSWAAPIPIFAAAAGAPVIFNGRIGFSRVDRGKAADMAARTHLLEPVEVIFLISFAPSLERQPVPPRAIRPHRKAINRKWISAFRKPLMAPPVSYKRTDANCRYASLPG